MSIGHIRDRGNNQAIAKDLYFYDSTNQNKYTSWSNGTANISVSNGSKTTTTQKGIKVPRGLNTLIIESITSWAYWEDGQNGTEKVYIGTTFGGSEIKTIDMWVEGNSQKRTRTSSLTLNISAYAGKTIFLTLYCSATNNKSQTGISIGTAYITKL